MPAAIAFAVLSALSNACSAVLQRLAVVDRTSQAKSGWRTAVDRRATTGVQPDTFDGVPVYVMPNPSGLNAHARVEDLAEHLRAAADLADEHAQLGR